MSTAAHQRRGRGSGGVDFAPSGGEYQLTELKNVSTSRANSTNTVEFSIRLVHAIRDHPCFFDPHDAHFGSGHQAAQHRQAAWQQVVSSIGFSGGSMTLQNMWKKLKERYTKERREGPAAGEELLDESLASEMAWLDEFVLPGMPPASSADRSLYFMDGDEEDLLGDDFVDQHDYQVDSALGEVQRRGTRSPAGSAHSGTGSDIDVGGSSMAPSHPLGTKNMPGSSASHGGMSGASGPRTIQLQGVRQPAVSGGTTTPHSYRFVNASGSSHHHAHPGEGMTVSSRGNGSLVAPKREGSVAGGGSTLTMVIDPTTYYQNGTQKMYRLVNVADLDQSSAHPLQHLRPSTAAGMGGGGGVMGAEQGGGGGAGMGFSIGRGTRKRMGAPLSPPSHAGGSGMLGGPSSSADHHHHSSPYGKAGGQLGDDLILDDGIVGENTIVIDHQRDDESPLLVDSPGMHHHHHMMMGGSSQRGMHRALQHSPTLMGNGSGARSYSPGLGSQGPSFNTSSQYDADLALQHFISSHLARMNEDDKALAKLNIQRILLDARFGTGTTLRVCMGEEDAELTDAAVAAEMPE